MWPSIGDSIGSLVQFYEKGIKPYCCNNLKGNFFEIEIGVFETQDVG